MKKLLPLLIVGFLLLLEVISTDTSANFISTILIIILSLFFVVIAIYRYKKDVLERKISLPKPSWLSSIIGISFLILISSSFFNTLYKRNKQTLLLASHDSHLTRS